MNILRILFPREPLCYSCINAFIVRGFREREERIYCPLCAPQCLVPFPVRDCSGYLSRTPAEAAAGANPGPTEVAGFIRKVGFAPPIANGKNSEEA